MDRARNFGLREAVAMVKWANFGEKTLNKREKLLFMALKTRQKSVKNAKNPSKGQRRARIWQNSAEVGGD